MFLYLCYCNTIQESETKKKGDRAVYSYMSCMRAIYRAARLEFNEPDRGLFRIPVDVFEYYRVPKQPRNEHRDIPMEWVQMMIDQRQGLSGRMRLGVDVFLIMFGLMGMNLVDMYNLQEKPKKGVIHYYRTKTKDSKDDGAEMYVRMEPAIRKIIADYMGEDGLFRFRRMYSTNLNFIVAVNKGIRQWIEKNKLTDFTCYSARHTWATIAASKKAEIDSRLITEGLCHSDSGSKMDNVYIRKDWERVWDANAKVLALFRW